MFTSIPILSVHTISMGPGSSGIRTRNYRYLGIHWNQSLKFIVDSTLNVAEGVAFIDQISALAGSS